MQLSAAGRIVTFALAVLVLAGLGVYLFLPQPSAATAKPRPSARRSHRPTPSPSSPGPAQDNIYQWVPFTQSGLTSAAALTTKFASDYGTYSYTESTSAYLAPMQPLASGELVQVIGRAFASPGVAAVRTSSKQVSTGTAAIVSLRAFGPTSLTFVVAVTQQISATKGSKRQVTDYAVTVTGTGTNWQVSDIELAGAGNL